MFGDWNIAVVKYYSKVIFWNEWIASEICDLACASNQTAQPIINDSI